MTTNTEQLLWPSLPSTDSFCLNLPEALGNTAFDLAILEQPNTYLIPNEWQTWVSSWQSMLSASPGLVLIRCQAAHNDEQLRKIYACISRALGQLNDRYGYFFDVKDQGLDYTKSPIPVSKTNAETSFHTDSTAKYYFPDIVGLLCIHPAAQGGDSLVTNAAGAYQDLSHRFPEHAASLCRPLFRDVITPGSTYDEEAIRNNAFPIFSTDQRGFHFRYMRYWVERAYEKLSIPLDQQVIEGMDAIDHYFHQPENRIQFRMERGDMLFVNNRFLCHNRTAFTTSSPPRTLVRSWINWTDHA